MSTFPYTIPCYPEPLRKVRTIHPPVSVKIRVEKSGGRCFRPSATYACTLHPERLGERALTYTHALSRSVTCDEALTMLRFRVLSPSGHLTPLRRSRSALAPESRSRPNVASVECTADCADLAVVYVKRAALCNDKQRGIPRKSPAGILLSQFNMGFHFTFCAVFCGLKNPLQTQTPQLGITSKG